MLALKTLTKLTPSEMASYNNLVVQGLFTTVVWYYFVAALLQKDWFLIISLRLIKKKKAQANEESLPWAHTK